MTGELQRHFLWIAGSPWGLPPREQRLRANQSFAPWGQAPRGRQLPQAVEVAGQSALRRGRPDGGEVTAGIRECQEISIDPSNGSQVDSSEPRMTAVIGATGTAGFCPTRQYLVETLWNGVCLFGPKVVRCVRSVSLTAVGRTNLPNGKRLRRIVGGN